MSDDLFKELYTAVHDGDLVKVKNIFSVLPDANVRTREIWVKWPFLHCARSVEITKLLLSLGADINAKDISGLTPLHSAITSFKELDVVKELLSQGANVNATDYEGNTPLTLAIIYENFEAIRELMDQGADINIKTTSSFLGYATCLCIAVRDYMECAKLLIKISLKNHFDEDLKKIIDLDSFSDYANYQELSLYLDKCVYEIGHMKMNKISKYFTLYELVVKSKDSIRPVFRCFENLEDNIKINYPIYHDLIMPQIKLCVERAELFNRMRGILICLRVGMINKEVILNSDCVYKVIEHLSNKDLFNFLKSFDQSDFA